MIANTHYRTAAHRGVLLIVFAAIVLWNAQPALASRQRSKAAAFHAADIVLVGFISSVRIPALEHTQHPSTVQTSISKILDSPRIIRMVVARQAKGPRSPRMRTIRVTFGHGLMVQAGDRVIAFHYPDGTWRIDTAPAIQRDLHLPPITHEPPASP